MRCFYTISLIVMVFGTCRSRSVFEIQEQSVVSVYTTQPTTAGTSQPLDVYRQIANNIAEKLTSPIYKFLGIGNNKTDETTTTKQPWDKIELLDEIPEDVTKAELKPVDNDISKDRDIEELSVEALRRTDKKPEKITLFSSYLPTNERLENNDTVNEIDIDSDDEFDENPFEFNDDNEEKPREGGFVYLLELIGSIVQLAWGAFLALFKPSNSTYNSS